MGNSDLTLCCMQVLMGILGEAVALMDQFKSSALCTSRNLVLLTVITTVPSNGQQGFKTSVSKFFNCSTQPFSLHPSMLLRPVNLQCLILDRTLFTLAGVRPTVCSSGVKMCTEVNKLVGEGGLIVKDLRWDFILWRRGLPCVPSLN